MEKLKFERLTKRRKKLIESLKENTNSAGIVLLFGNSNSPMNYKDNEYRFRQDSTFMYFFDYHEHADLAATIDLDSGEEIIYGDELTTDDIVWTGILPTIKNEAEKIGINKILPRRNLEKIIKEASKQGRTIHFIPPYRAEHKLELIELLNIKEAEIEPRKSLELIKAIVNLRNHKSEWEISEIEKAVNISYQMHKNAIIHAKAGMKEYEIKAIISKTAQEMGAELSFPTICTVHGETLHNHHYHNTLENGKMLLIDAGAEISTGYAGDLSSTLPISGKFTERQKLIYDIVYRSHYAAVKAMKPGVSFKECYYTSCKEIFNGLKELGLTKGDADEAVHTGANALFFQCGLGHMMGMDVHDMENLGEVWVGYDGVEKSTQFGIKSLRLARPLEAGFVLTIEPGIYFIPYLIDKWKAENKFSQFINYSEVEKWKDFGGIRNEEDYLITPDGHRILGNPISKKIEDIEALRS